VSTHVSRDQTEENEGGGPSEEALRVNAVQAHSLQDGPAMAVLPRDFRTSRDLAAGRIRKVEGCVLGDAIKKREILTE